MAPRRSRLPHLHLWWQGAESCCSLHASRQQESRGGVEVEVVVRVVVVVAGRRGAAGAGPSPAFTKRRLLVGRQLLGGSSLSSGYPLVVYASSLPFMWLPHGSSVLPNQREIWGTEKNVCTGEIWSSFGGRLVTQPQSFKTKIITFRHFYPWQLNTGECTLNTKCIPWYKNKQ